jgi:hypothetical protein
MVLGQKRIEVAWVENHLRPVRTFQARRRLTYVTLRQTRGTRQRFGTLEKHPAHLVVPPRRTYCIPT